MQCWLAVGDDGSMRTCSAQAWHGSHASERVLRCLSACVASSCITNFYVLVLVFFGFCGIRVDLVDKRLSDRENVDTLLRRERIGWKRRYRGSLNEGEKTCEKHKSVFTHVMR